MLKIENLTKAYGNFYALNNLNMYVEKGALYGFIGPNGAGKTTAIRIITGLLQPNSGNVRVCGTELKSSRELKTQIGYVPDSFGVYDNLKVSEYMDFFASCYGLEGLASRRRCEELLGQVGLEDRAGSYVDGLSKGMKQRLCLARALIHDPALLVMDEPASGLDPRTRFEYKEILLDLRNQGKTILVSSHILSELTEVCTNIGIIDQGKMVMQGRISDILNRIDTTRPLSIAVMDQVSRALSILKSHPCVQTISIKGKEISVGFHGDEADEALLLRQLMDAEVPVRSFMRQEGSIESVFMQITSKDEKDKAVLSYEN